MLKNINQTVKLNAYKAIPDTLEHFKIANFIFKYHTKYTNLHYFTYSYLHIQHLLKIN